MRFDSVSEFVAVASVFVLLTSTIISGRMLALQRRIASKVDAEKITERLASLELRTSQMPTHADLANVSIRLSVLESAIARAGAQVEGVGKALDGVSRRLEIIQEHLLDGKAS